jgi:CrcB protein
MSGFLFVGIGGAAGSMLRYAISLIPSKNTFPFLTLITNILGAILIGCITGFAMKRNVNKNVMLLLKTGLCGGFTTFSTFSLEAYSLMQSGKLPLAVIYAAASLFGCIGGVWLGREIF